jgi:hypothetical protein
VRLDGIEDYGEAEIGMVSIDFGSWFVPFATVRPPTPYVTTPPAAAGSEG